MPRVIGYGGTRIVHNLKLRNGILDLIFSDNVLSQVTKTIGMGYLSLLNHHLPEQLIATSFCFTLLIFR